MKVSILPKDDRPGGWAACLPEPPPARRLTGDGKADWVVVGAGFAGLAAARRLGELLPEARIALVEAGRVGQGASGRNSGFVIDLPHNVDSENIENVEANRRFLRLNQAAIAWLAELVETHQIRCDWRRRGKYQAAVTERGERFNGPFVRGLKLIGQEYQELGRDEIAARLGTRYYRHAVYTPGCILMQPAALVRGLARSLPANVDLYENSPVISFSFGAFHRLETPDGSIAAPKVVLATNGFTDGWGLLPGRLIRVVAFANLTRPLSEAQLATMGSDENWGVTPADPGGTTLRRTADNRILVRTLFRYGGDPDVTESQIARARSEAEISFRRRWPQLGAPDFEQTWAGVVCFSRNFAPYWGELVPGVLAAVCCNAVGAAKCTIMGRAIAERAVGLDSEIVRDMAAFPRPVAHGLGPLLGPAVTAKLAWDRFKAGAET